MRNPCSSFPTIQNFRHEGAQLVEESLESFFLVLLRHHEATAALQRLSAVPLGLQRAAQGKKAFIC